MRCTTVKISSSDEVDVDAIVAGYTALARQDRRDNRRRGWRRAGLAATMLAGGALVWLSGVPTSLLEGRASSADDLRDLRALVSSELEKLGMAREELAAERDRYSAGSAALERELAAFTERQGEIERQQASLTEQATALQGALAAVDRERDALVAAARARSPAVERELAAISEQRRQLEDQQASFSSQGRQLSDELAQLEKRRTDLATARAAMDQQRRELEALIRSASRLPEPTSRLAEPQFDSELAPLLASAVDAPALGEIRGGVQLGNGMNIDIGLTRSASINGVEQYSNVLQLDDLAGMDAAALAGIGTSVIQNGAGNFLAPTVLDGLSSGFGTIIQNSLDGQEIRTSTTYDIAISDVSSALRDMATSQAISDTLTLQQ